MTRREFISIIGGAAAAWPFSVRAQQPAIPIIGFLHNQSLEAYKPFVAAFWQGLRQAGYKDGDNISIQYRWGENDSSRLPRLAADLVRVPVAVLVAGGGDDALTAAKAETASIPIVATLGRDPIDVGLVQSLNRPGGNITGVSVFAVQLVRKRFEIAHELAPNESTIAYLTNSINPNARIETPEVETAANTLGRRILVLQAATEVECAAAFATVAQHRAGALIVESDPFFNKITDQLVRLAQQHSLHVVYPRREFAVAGGLISYGSSLTEAYRQLGIYTGRVLKGDKPAELPILLPSKFELVLNLKTATALGITMPTSLLLRADEVIE